MFTRFKMLMMACLMACISAANATPVLMMDLDPSTPGIQTTFTATEGDSLSFNLVAFDDGVREPPLFPPASPPGFPPILVDTVAVDLLLTGSGLASLVDATAGAFGLGLPGAIDLFDLAPLGLDPGLATGLSFGGIGAHGYSALPFDAIPLSITDAITAASADVFDVLIEYSFTADSAGTVDFETLGSPDGAELLYAFAPTGGPLMPTEFISTLTILSSTPPTGLPEPASLILVMIGLAAIRRRASNN